MVVAGAGGLDVVPGITQRSARWRAKFPIELHNSGNSEVRVALVPFDAADETVLEMDRDVVTLAPQATTNLTLKAKMRSPSLRGAPQARPLVVAVHGHERGADMKRPGQPVPPGSDPLHRTVPLMLTQSPILSKSVMALGGLLVVGVLALVAYRSFLFKDFEPEVAAPTAGPNVVHEPLANAVSVQWSRISGVSGYVLELRSPSSGLERIELTSDADSHLAGGLRPGETYDITVTPVVDELNGFSTQFSEQPARADLPPPTAVTARPTGSGTEHAVSWAYDDTILPTVTFNVLDMGTIVAGPVIGTTSTNVELGPGERSITIQVISTDDPSRTGMSDPSVVSVAAPTNPDESATGDSGDSGGSGDGGGDTGNGGVASRTEALPQAQAAVAAKPFMVVLDIGSATPQGGIDGESAIGTASTFEILVGIEIGDVEVVALPAASYTITIPGQSAGTNTPEGWVVGALSSTEDEANALCEHPAWETNAALASVRATYGCLVFEVR
jgi:hypothetical protein